MILYWVFKIWILNELWKPLSSRAPISALVALEAIHVDSLQAMAKILAKLCWHWHWHWPFLVPWT